MKTVGTYQFTAIGKTSATEHDFNFPRIYKQPDQKIMLTVASISYLATKNVATEPYTMFLSGIGEITGKCNVERDVGTTRTTSNRWYLGSAGFSETHGANYSVASQFAPARMMIDDLPLNPFTISVEHYSPITGSETGQFLVSFNIDVTEC